MVRCEKCFESYDDRIAAGVCPHCGYYTGESQADPRYLPIGFVLHDRYVIGGVIGVGGFGITYKAWDRKYGVCKAVKEYFQQGVVNRVPGEAQVFVSSERQREEFLYGKERLINEARIVAKFQSSSIVRVEDYFEENGTSYMVMEYLHYKTLQDFVIDRKRLLDPDEAIEIGVHLCEALEEIHSAGVIHRDISPDNIFVGEHGEVKVIDFGSARLSREDTDSRLIVFKPGFAPPEQYEKIDPNNDLQQGWTDVYALGATLYTALTGSRPAEASDRKADYDNHTDRVPYPHTINPSIPPFLSNAIMTAMAINIHERFQNATQFKEALLKERKVEPVETVRRKKRIRRTAGIGLGIAAVVVLLCIFSGNLAKNKAEVLLEPAEISVWYPVGADGDTSSVRDQGMQTVLEALQEGDQFNSVTVTLRPIPEDVYSETLQAAYDAGEMPDVFACTDPDATYMQAARGVESLLKDASADYDLSDEAVAQLATRKMVPMGFHIPVVYVNTTATGSVDGVSVSSMDDVWGLGNGEMQFKPAAVSPVLEAAYTDMVSGFSDALPDMTATRTDFLSGAAAAYYADTADYFNILAALPGQVAMLPIAGETVQCRFADAWSVSATADEAVQMAADAFVMFLTTNNAQDRFYIQCSNTGLPLNTSARNVYVSSVRRQFEPIVQGMEHYQFR